MTICTPTQAAYQHLLREIRAFLVEVGQEHADAVYCFVLQYIAVKNPLPPSLSLGWVYELPIVAEAPAWANYGIWAPIVFSERQYEVEFDEATTAACEALIDTLDDLDRNNVIGKLLTRIAKEITRTDWTGILNVTPEFVCFAVDYELEGPVENAIRRCATREKITRLEQKGML